MIYCIIQCNPLISTFYISTFLYIDIFSYSRMKVFLIYLLLLHYIYISTFPYIDINIFFPVDVDISELHCIFLYLSFIKITCGISLCQYLKCMEIFLNSNFSVKFGIWEKVEISLYKKKLNNVFALTHFQSYLYNLARFCKVLAPKSALFLHFYFLSNLNKSNIFTSS